ncbi:hypothetical protein L3073_11605 [Ancylomarina sp. DW003]|nr:hypothetical protein [Ancylomarina sp. DW003]MDE5422855.1 hypothetical protein [Ancylomarina sp. DW003]
MKRLLTAILCMSLFMACSTDRYLLSGSADDNTFLIDKIKESQEMGLITARPLIVIDGVPHRYSKELKEKPLELTRSQIRKIDILKKDVGVRLYGDEGKAGVVVVTVKTKNKRWTKDEVILYIADGKVITKEELKQIKPSEIESINIVKDKGEFKLYTDKKCDGLVVITLKKKE